MSVASPTEPPNKTTMNNKSNIIIGAIAVIALLGVILLALRGPGAATPVAASFGAVSNTNAPAAGSVLANGQLLPNPSVYDYLVSRVFLYADKAIGYGNSTSVPVLQQAVRQAIVASSSVACSLQNPFSTATSSFEITVNISSTSASSASLIIATASNTGATTTLLATVPYSANSQLSIATQGTSTTNLAGVVAPSAYLNLGALTGGSATLSQLGGNCDAIFTSTN